MVWPSGPVPVPKVGGVLLEKVDSHHVQYLQTASGIEIPPDLAMRQVPTLELDADSLVGFMASYGPLTPFEGAPLLPDNERAGQIIDGLVTVDLLAHHVRVLRAVVSHWMAYQEHNEDGIISAWTDNGFNHPKAPSPVSSAWRWWVDHVNVALRPFSVTVTVTDGYGNFGLERPQVTSYSAMMLQIVNDISAGTPWRRCANEPCRLPFVRQVGRADYGQYRTKGVRYCSKHCAKAQVERERRRRIRKENQ